MVIKEISDIIPHYDSAAAQRKLNALGWRYMKRFSDDTIFFNRERVSGLTGPCLCLANHLSMKDYPLSKYILSEAKLPQARVVAGNNLNNWLFRALFGLDFEDFGIFWYDKNDRFRHSLESYFPPIYQVLNSGESLFIFPEGTRNRHPELGTRKFNAGFLWGVVEAQRKLKDDIPVVCIGIQHEKIPERDFYRFMDWKNGCIYFLGDACACAYNRFSSTKGKTFINFAKPVSLRILAGNGKPIKKARDASKKTQEIISELLKEMIKLNPANF